MEQALLLSSRQQCEGCAAGMKLALACMPPGYPLYNTKSLGSRSTPRYHRPGLWRPLELQQASLGCQM